MSRRIILAAVLGSACAAAPAQAARVDLMVVGSSKVMRAPRPVTLATATVRAGGRSCRVAAATPLAALARTRLKLKLRDYGSCSRRPADAGSLYVRGIGRDVERGRAGWVFKIGHATPSTGAGDAASRLRAGAHLLWFWCRNGGGGCQRTLDVRPARTTAAAGGALRVTVTAYDDNGRGKRVAGATVRLGSATATTGADGVATVTVPAGSATLSAVATHDGMVRSFPARVHVR